MYQIRKCSKLYVPNSKLLKNATSIIIASNFLMFPVSLLQLNSKNIATLMQKLSENETQNTVSKLKFVTFVLCCASENGYILGSYNLRWQWQSGSFCGLSLQIVLQLKCSSVYITVALLCTNIKIISLLFFFLWRISGEKYLKGRNMLRNFYPGFSLKKWVTGSVGMNVFSQYTRFLFINFKFWEEQLFQRSMEKKGKSLKMFPTEIS